MDIENDIITRIKLYNDSLDDDLSKGDIDYNSYDLNYISLPYIWLDNIYEIHGKILTYFLCQKYISFCFDVKCDDDDIDNFRKYNDITDYPNTKDLNIFVETNIIDILYFVFVTNKTYRITIINLIRFFSNHVMCLLDDHNYNRLVEFLKDNNKTYNMNFNYMNFNEYENDGYIDLKIVFKFIIFLKYVKTQYNIPIIKFPEVRDATKSIRNPVNYKSSIDSVWSSLSPSEELSKIFQKAENRNNYVHNEHSKILTRINSIQEDLKLSIDPNYKKYIDKLNNAMTDILMDYTEINKAKGHVDSNARDVDLNNELKDAKEKLDSMNVLYDVFIDNRDILINIADEAERSKTTQSSGIMPGNQQSDMSSVLKTIPPPPPPPSQPLLPLPPPPPQSQPPPPPDGKHTGNGESEYMNFKEYMDQQLSYIGEGGYRCKDLKDKIITLSKQIKSKYPKYFVEMYISKLTTNMISNDLTDSDEIISKTKKYISNKNINNEIEKYISSLTESIERLSNNSNKYQFNDSDDSD